MRCPLGLEQLRPAAGPAPLGLCGPSELAGSLGRELLELPAALESLALPAHVPVGPGLASPADVAGLLRAKLRHLSRGVGAALLRPRVGRADVAELIASFLPESPPLARTANGGWALRETGSANVDLFFQAVPQACPEENRRLWDLLEGAWRESPDTCVRQVFLLGASREGKQDRYSFYDAMLWLWDRQPATVLANLHLIPEANYWKGLLELVARVCEGPRRSLQRDQATCRGTRDGKLVAMSGPQSKGYVEGWKPGSRLEMAREALKRYDSDPLYRTLFESVGRLFADQLREDLASMRAGQRVGLCAKWCPSLYHSFDRRTLICESVARWLFPCTLPEFEGLSEREHAFRARDMLRGALSELREHIKSPERLMCQRRWAEIDYKAVPATCMKINAHLFQKHDSARFMKHLENLASGRVRANTGALLPHEILCDARCRQDRPGGVRALVAQAQWEALVAKIKDEGALDDCIAVCDVSGSMQARAGRGAQCMDLPFRCR